MAESSRAKGDRDNRRRVIRAKNFAHKSSFGGTKKNAGDIAFAIDFRTDFLGVKSGKRRRGRRGFGLQGRVVGRTILKRHHQHQRKSHEEKLTERSVSHACSQFRRNIDERPRTSRRIPILGWMFDEKPQFEKACPFSGSNAQQADASRFPARKHEGIFRIQAFQANLDHILKLPLES